MNGDNAEEPGPHPTLSQVPSFLRPVGGHTQIYAPAQNENVYTNLWRGPYYGFRRVIDYFRFTDSPRRLKPIGIYYHFYSGTKTAAIKALHDVYAWAREQETFPVWASEYAATVRGFEQASLARRLDGRWLFRGLGALATVRLPTALGWPDLDKSEGVVGVRDLPQGRYVALAPAKNPSLALSAAAPRGPYLLASNAAVTSFERSDAGLSLHLRGHMPVEVEIGGCAQSISFHRAPPSGSPLRKASNAGPVGTIQVKGRTCGSRVETREGSMSPVSEASPVSPAARRPRLITPHGLAVVAVTVAASLAVLFPGLDFGHPRFLAHPDELSIAYLDQVLRQRPDDRSARLLLARQQVALGKWSEAEANLRLLVERHDDAITWRARLALVELERAEVDALPPSDAARGARQATALRELRRVATAPIERGDLARMAEVALALESPGDAAAIYERLASQEPARRREWALLAGRWYRAAGQLPESAAAYLAASAAAGPHDDGAADLLAAIDVMRATDDGARALQVIEPAIGRWPADRRLLARAVDLALAQNDVRRAQSFGARLVALAPGEDRVLSRQLDLDLAVGDNEAALRTLSALVERRPDDESLRRRLAQIATWANRPAGRAGGLDLARRARRAGGQRESARAGPGALRAQIGHRSPRGEGAASRLEAARRC